MSRSLSSVSFHHFKCLILRVLFALVLLKFVSCVRAVMKRFEWCVFLSILNRLNTYFSQFKFESKIGRGF
jgi:hypothetical protein